MKTRQLTLSFLSAIILVSLTGAVNADTEMLTYTNEEYGFSIKYPEDWTVKEGMTGSVVTFMGPIEDDFLINVCVGTEELSTKMTTEEYAESCRKWLLEGGFEIVETFSDTSNGKPVAGFIMTFPEEEIDAKQKQAYFVSGMTAYLIIFSAARSAYDDADDNYFDPMLQSFNFREKEEGIEIQNFIVTPSKVETGEEVKVKFEAVNKGNVEKTKTFYLVDSPPGTEHPLEIDFKTVTLAPGETEFIEFIFISKEVGKHIILVEDQTRSIEVVEKISPVPGFEAVFAIAGLLAVAYLLRRNG